MKFISYTTTFVTCSNFKVCIEIPYKTPDFVCSFVPNSTHQTCLLSTQYLEPRMFSPPVVSSEADKLSSWSHRYSKIKLSMLLCHTNF
jgi:hypothetical protein